MWRGRGPGISKGLVVVERRSEDYIDDVVRRGTKIRVGGSLHKTSFSKVEWWKCSSGTRFSSKGTKVKQGIPDKVAS